MKESEFKWLLVLPPLGFARTQGLAVVQAFREELSEGVFVFDTQEELHRIQSSLRSDEDVAALDWTNQQMLVRALEWKVTHLLCLSSAPLDPHYLNLLRAQGIKTLHWLYEEARVADYWTQVLMGYDLFCSNQRGAVERTCEEQRVPFVWLPLGALEKNKATLSLWHARPLDVVFAGSSSPYRIQVLERLASVGLSIGIYGDGWDEQKSCLSRFVVHPEAGVNELFQKARMVVHLSPGQPTPEVTESPMGPSIWDAISCGAYPMIEKGNGNRENLEGVVFQEFSSAAELLALCMAMRQNGVDQSVIEANQGAIQKGHTLNHRIRKIFQIADFS